MNYPTEDEEKAQLVRVLTEMAGRVPHQSYQRWDVMRVREFLAAVLAAKKAAAKARATVSELRSAHSRLESFWS